MSINSQQIAISYWRFSFIYSYPLITSHIPVISSLKDCTGGRGPISISLLIILSISIRERDYEGERERDSQSSRFRGKITFGDGSACNERTKASAASNVRNYSILAIKSGAGSALTSSTQFAASICGWFVYCNKCLDHVLPLHTILSRRSDISIILPIANRTIASY